MPLLSSILQDFLSCLTLAHSELFTKCAINLSEQVIIVTCPDAATYEAITDAWIGIAVTFYEAKKRLGAPATSRLKLICDGKKTIVTNGLPKGFLLQSIKPSL